MSHNIGTDNDGDGRPLYDDEFIGFFEQFAEAAKTEGAEASFRVAYAYLDAGGSMTDPVPEIIA